MKAIISVIKSHIATSTYGKVEIIAFIFVIFAEPFRYEAFLDDYLSLGESKNDKQNQYAPVYPMFGARPTKRRQNSDHSLESSSGGEQSSSDWSITIRELPLK